MVCKSFSLVCYFISTFNFYVIVSTFLFNIHVYLYSPRAGNRFNQVVEAKRFEGVFLCRKVC